MFKVTDGEIIMGTAFVVKVDSESNVCYLLTAYHVICELEAKDLPIIVLDEENNALVAHIEFPADLSSEYRLFGKDYALLTVITENAYSEFITLSGAERRDCYVRGAASFFRTEFSSIDGKFLGREKIIGQYDHEVLQLKLNISQMADNDNCLVRDQNVLRGLSGAPVLTEIENEEVCIGILGNIEGGSGNGVAYAVPIETVISECLIPRGIRCPQLRYKESKIRDKDALMELVLGDTDEFFFSDETAELKAWNTLSDLFYRGLPVDSILWEYIQSKDFDTYSAEVQSCILYFHARLLFKRGKSRQALKDFEQITKLNNKVSFDSQVKLSLLIHGRKLVETEAMDPNEKLKAIRQAGDRISRIPKASNEYIAMEMASLYGRGLTTVFSQDAGSGNLNKQDLIHIFNDHRALMDEYPNQLRKQDVVSTSLRWYLDFYEINRGNCDSELKESIEEGFQQSKIRKNNIFYIQCVIAYGMAMYLKGNTNKAAQVMLLATKLMQMQNITFSHEGVRQLVGILRKNAGNLAVLIEMAYQVNGMSKLLYEKAELLLPTLTSRELRDIIYTADEIYTQNYSGKTKPYNVSIEQIKLFL